MNPIVRFVKAFIWAIFSAPYEAYSKAARAEDTATLWGIALGKALVFTLSWLMWLAALALFIIWGLN